MTTNNDEIPLDEIETCPEDEVSLAQAFTECETVIEANLADKLNGNEKNEKLRDCVRRLQGIIRSIQKLDLFSTNDIAEDLPTSSLHFLLAPAYLAYAIADLKVEIERRATYLQASKIHYREFLRTLYAYELISFKLPWSDEAEEDKDDHCKETTSSKTKGPSMEEAMARREQKITRQKQIDELEQLLDQFKREIRSGNDDEAQQRKILVAMLRLWAFRALKELEMIEEELVMLKHFAEQRRQQEESPQLPKKQEHVPLKPFIIARNQQQKAVFGLGYPSIPTVSVDEWYNQMSKNGGFGHIHGLKKPVTIQGQGEHLSDNEDDEKEENEEKRRRQIQFDEWRDTHPRGWGNTYNKG